jgi:hypothetical protein
MKNPFKPDRSVQDRDNPVVPNIVERPVERAVGDGPGDGVNYPGPVDRAGIDDGPGDRPGIKDSPADIARGRAAARAPVVDRRLDEGPGDTRQMDLFPNEELVGYRTQWESIQTGFVDRPRAAVEQADALVSQVVSRLTDVFTRERSALEKQWTKGDNVSTEELRIALTRYRSFFHRLLSM